VQKRTGKNSFWQLPLPKETKYYVPKLLAVAAIISNPEKYGVRLPNVTNQPYFTEVKLKKSVNLTHVAKSTDLHVDTLNKLNPDYKAGMSLKDGFHTLLVPIHKAREISMKLKGIIAIPVVAKKQLKLITYDF
jgi:membrane-bound lytic murein transglycosylase D